jgi:ElaB/YqjD/DUF883 family membrane-anchored ribosome-binding protein
MHKKANGSADAGVERDAHAELEIAKQSVMDAYASFLDAKKHLHNAALAAGLDMRESAGEAVGDALDRARMKKDDVTDSTSDYIKENPFTSASIAFLGGVIFSRLFGK